MIYFIIVGIIIAIIWYFSWYGLAERINPDDFQDLPPKDSLLKGAEPFFFEGKSNSAFLLIHGYESSPYSLRQIGNILKSMDHTVLCPLLPGHGTSLVELSKTRYEHWYEAVRRIYVRERPKYKNFFIVGFSLGGNLALRLAIQYKDTVAPSALVLISSPVQLNGFLNHSVFMRDWRLMFTGIGKYILPPVSKKRDVVSADIMNPTVSYNEAYSLPPLHSFRTNIGKVKKYLKDIKVPACLIHASNDWTVNAENMHYIFRKLGSKEKRAYMFAIEDKVSTRHELMTHEQIRDKVIHYIFSFLNEFFLDFKYQSEMLPKNLKSNKGWFS